jgi:hypothetical protein
MKKRLIQTIAQGEVMFGQVSDPNDLLRAQDFLHGRISAILNDFVNNHRDREITGFGYDLGDGNSLAIEIRRPGRIHLKNGTTFDLLADYPLTLEAADDTLPRIDTVVAVLEDEVAAEPDLIPFVRLRTADEFDENTPPYPPQNFNVPTEMHWRAVPQIRTGTPADVPSPAALATNEVPLYYVAVAPEQTSIRHVDILDLRDVILTLRRINDLGRESRIDIQNLIARVTRLEKLAGQPIDLTQIFGAIKTLGEILAELQRQIDSLRDVPEIRYARPKTMFTDINLSKIVAEGNTDGGFPCVDIPMGAHINFGTSDVVLLPQNFEDQTLNPRFVQVGGGTSHIRRTVNLTLDSVTQIDGDGFVDFAERLSSFSAGRSRPACAARDGQHVEIFGGLGADNTSSLGDWFTYDVINDTLTPRTPGSALPSANRPALFPCGDEANVLLIAASNSTSEPRCFKVNAVTMAVTEITGTKPTGRHFVGDLIAPNKIFIVAVRGDGINDVEVDYWEFNTSTNTFTQLGVTGNLPVPRIDQVAGCNFGTNKFVLVTFDGGVFSSGKTYIFDRPSLQWTRQMIPQPYDGTSATQFPISQFRIANVNGRPVLVGSKHSPNDDINTCRIWELVRPQATKNLAWEPMIGTFPPTVDAGLCSTIGSNGLASAKAFLFGGVGLVAIAKPHIYSSVQGGLIAVTHNGSPGISIGRDSTFAQFEIDEYTASWPILGYWATLHGEAISPFSVKVEVSFDGGTTWKPLKLEETMSVDLSSDPGVRRCRITLFGSKDGQRPVLTKLVEILDEDGDDLEDRTVLRYDTPFSSTMAFYVDRKGVITLSSTVEPSTPDKALLHKVIPDGSNPPAVKNYINRRRAHFKYEGIRGTDDTFDNELAVPVRYVDARGWDSSRRLLALVSPFVQFDEIIEVDGGGVLSNGDGWIVEIAG